MGRRNSIYMLIVELCTVESKIATRGYEEMRTDIK
jgi:hypothetical protein